MPSSAVPAWEEIVNRVVIAGDNQRVSTAADRWHAAFSRVDALRESVERLSTKSAESWQGGGADAFRAHLKNLVAALRTTADAHRKVAQALTACAEQLQTATRTMPVPGWMNDEVHARRSQAQRNGAAPGFPAGAFWNGFQQRYPNADLDDARTYYASYEQRAQQVYLALCDGYRKALAEMPRGTRVNVAGARPQRATANGATTSTGGQQTIPAQPTLAPATGATSPATVPSVGSGSIPGLDPGTLAPFDPGALKPIDLAPVDLAGTGLAGAGDLGGAGVGGAGFGGAGVGGAGVGGIGAGKLPALGAVVSPPESVMTGGAELKGRAGPPAAGTAGLTGSALASSMLGGTSPGAASQDGEHTSPLKETFNVFGPDDSVPPGVIDF